MQTVFILDHPFHKIETHCFFSFIVALIALAINFGLLYNIFQNGIYFEVRRMDLEWVQAFLAVADTGSFSAAADALFLSQPVISKQVQKLEHQLGVRLFDRAHRRAELTDAGRRAYPPAQALARQYQLLEQAVHPDGSLRLALLPVADCYGFPQMLADFSAAYPRTRLMVEERENTAMPALIQSGRCDGAFFRVPDGPVMPEDVILCKDELVLLVPEKLFCATKGAVPLSLFSGKRFLLLSAGTGLLETSLELCRKAGDHQRVSRHRRRHYHLRPRSRIRAAGGAPARTGH